MRHPTYTEMCIECGNINLERRDVKKDLTGKIAIVTGGRIKNGYETAIRLLRNNCTVIVTSRFVDDCLDRYKKDKDYEKFKKNLFIYQLNLLSGENIKNFVQYITKTFYKIDYLINNAAQTIERPAEFYKHLIDRAHAKNETQSVHLVSEPLDKSESTKLSTSPIDGCYVAQKLNPNNDSKIIVQRDVSEFKYLKVDQMSIKHKEDKISDFFPPGKFDQYGQQIDLRTKNSWILEADDVDISEVAEVVLINSIAPYILCKYLKPLLTKTGNDYSWIINVTSMEGIFNWNKKPTRHPHTNMAKASLNMFTRTSGRYYIKSNIVMVCVDTGWNNSQYPNSYDIDTPIDCADGAARILDPIYRELKTHSIFYKNFKKHNW
jgi:NAD(P)-dependent dehydrogenase (short-subunit alcohol dehydrogenase family)